MVDKHKILATREHEKIQFPDNFPNNCIEEFKGILGKASESKNEKDRLKFLGVGSDFKASYYIGCAWLIPPSENENGISIQVEPKIENADFIRMFVTALEVHSSKEAEYFSDYYHIDFESPAIQIESEQNLITPLLLLHYITLLEQLSKNGLRKNYVCREENLQSKIRGKILFDQHLKQNVFNKREDRIFCGYQEYTVDTPENRLLKKALVYAKNNLESIPSLKVETLDKIYSKLAPVEGAFEGVSEDVSLAQVGFVKSSKLYRHYDEAIKVAKMILQGVDYEVLEDKKNRGYKVHPFCIDMPRLYEMYVLSLLRKAYGDQIQFQVKGYRKTRVDYIKKSENEKLIIDAKYKPRYSEGNQGILDDIQEISRYARDEKILKALEWEPKVESAKGNYFPKCLIIYPDPKTKFEHEEGEEDDQGMIEMKDDFRKDGILSDSEHVRKIPGFKDFYKIAIPLPKK